jgi:hypothetical protein
VPNAALLHATLEVAEPTLDSKKPRRG